MSSLKEQDVVKNFSLESCNNGVCSFPNEKNKYTILYFYPKDNTPGCTTESKDFSSLRNEFASLDAVIYGISKDSIKSHHKFIEKQELKIDLLSDNLEIAEMFGVWVEKNMYGRKYMGINRSTFILDNKNNIIKSWNKVSVKGHAQEVLEYLKSV